MNLRFFIISLFLSIATSANMVPVFCAVSSEYPQEIQQASVDALPQADQTAWLSVVTILKRGGYSVEQIKNIIKSLQEKGCNVQDLQNEEYILEQAKEIVNANRLYKLKIIAGVAAGVAVVAGIAYYCKYRRSELSVEQRIKRAEELIKKQQEKVKKEKRDGEVALLEDDALGCAICYGTSSDEDARILPCNHVFHLDCLDQWFNKQGALYRDYDHGDRKMQAHTCPVCRAPFTQDS
ncbi:MAG: RING finger domain-containing protein [Candidatus Babeliales bacterium]